MNEEIKPVQTQEEFEKEIKYDYELMPQPKGKEKASILRLFKKAEEIDRDKTIYKSICGWTNCISVIKSVFRSEKNLMKKCGGNDGVFIYDESEGIAYLGSVHEAKYRGQSDELYVRKMYFEN